MTPPTLSADQVDRFIEDGFVHLEHIVPTEVVSAGQRVIWADLGMSPGDPSSWSGPVARLMPSDPGPFKAAFDSPGLASAFDQLVGVHNWLPRSDLGLFVARFPSPDEPHDTGWHIDSSYPPPDDQSAPLDFSRWKVNVSSQGRALLMLFLFSDVGPDDAPTRIRVGSHLDVAPILQPAGPGGMSGTHASVVAARASARRPTALATGAAGDVYLCHPFLVHGAQPVQGLVPRLLAQPPLVSRMPAMLERPDGAYSPVELGIRRGLESRRRAG
jgi:hypothetical protein